MLIIGSRALVHNNPELAETRKCVDWDYIATIDQFTAWHKANRENLKLAVPTNGGKYYHCRDKDGMNYEFEIAWPGTSAEMLLKIYGTIHVSDWEYPSYAINDDLLIIKLSHRYKRNSPHFLKTMADLKFLRSVTELEMDNRELAYFKAREQESYNYGHPKLNVSKEDFFKGDEVPYIYDHDSIHLTVALVRIAKEPWPAYKSYMKRDSEVMSSKAHFFGVSEETRLNGVYEESCVLALERSQIPFGLGKDGGPTPRQSFEMALMKVCTSITSGWFREYAWENYQKVLDLYEQMGEDDYIERFKRNAHLLKPYEGETY